MYFRLQCFLL